MNLQERLDKAVAARDAAYAELGIIAKVGAHSVGLAHSIVEVVKQTLGQTYLVIRNTMAGLIGGTITTIKAIPATFLTHCAHGTLMISKPELSAPERLEYLSQHELTAKDEPNWFGKLSIMLVAGINTAGSVVCGLVGTVLGTVEGLFQGLVCGVYSIFTNTARAYQRGMLWATSKLNPAGFCKVVDILQSADMHAEGRHDVLYTDAAGWAAYQAGSETYVKQVEHEAKAAKTAVAQTGSPASARA